jgi:hypothetical protein
VGVRIEGARENVFPGLPYNIDLSVLKEACLTADSCH